MADALIDVVQSLIELFSDIAKKKLPESHVDIYSFRFRRHSDTLLDNLRTCNRKNSPRRNISRFTIVVFSSKH